LCPPDERSVALAAGATNQIDPWMMATDALGQLAYGTAHDSTAEFWIFELPAGAGPFTQPPNSGLETLIK